MKNCPPSSSSLSFFVIHHSSFIIHLISKFCKRKGIQTSLIRTNKKKEEKLQWRIEEFLQTLCNLSVNILNTRVLCRTVFSDMYLYFYTYLRLNNSYNLPKPFTPLFQLVLELTTKAKTICPRMKQLPNDSRICSSCLAGLAYRWRICYVGFAGHPGYAYLLIYS